MKRFVLLFSLSLLLMYASSQQLAFPGAEGYGKFATGGRGGQVVAVTNLQDTGVGSIRWALDQYVDTIYVFKDSANPSYPVTIYQPLTVVFKVSGTINLKSDLKIKRDNLTIAGQTAPCDGICFTKRSVLFNGATTSQLFYFGPRRKNVIVRYLRFRPDVPLDTAGVPTGAFVTYGLDLENYENVIIDHCSISWANEECLATYDCKNTSIQWCIVNEGLYNAHHIKGLRGYGGVWGGQFASFQHNLLAHQNNRTPRWNGARAHDTIALVDYSNNVNYNWATSSAPYGGDVEVNGGIARLNIRNNYYKPGPATPGTHKLVRPDYSAAATGVGRFHVSGNIIEGDAARTNDNWLAVDFALIPTASRDSARSDTVFTIAQPVQLLTAQNAYDTVLQAAGAIYPKRDTVDRRIVNETRTRTTSGVGTSNKPGIIDSAAAVGGLPAYRQCAGPEDTDHDGMPDEWEIENGLNPFEAADRNITGGDGYTMLEQYLNGITTYIQSHQLCAAPGNLSIGTDITGTTYQWEEDQGNGFAAIIGQTDSVLQLQLPTSAYGFRYRCRVDGYQYSRMFKMKFENTWTGTVDAAWENAANWSCNQVPDIYTDVFINSGAVVVNSHALCRSIRVVSPAATVTVSPGFDIRVAH